MSKIDQIKTALSDPACESVGVIYIRDGVECRIKTYNKLMMSDVGLIDLEVKSFKVNHYKFDDLDVGDLVSCDGAIQTVISLESNGGFGLRSSAYIHSRHELVLLQKAKP